MIIEKEIIAYLSGRIPEVGSNVFAEVPVNPPSTYILVDKTSSSSEDFIERPEVAIQSISTSLLKSAEINEKVKELMEVIPKWNPSIFMCDLNSDYNYSDDGTKEYRYQAIFDLSY